jgi:hypothetical protein
MPGAGKIFLPLALNLNSVSFTLFQIKKFYSTWMALQLVFLGNGLLRPGNKGLSFGLKN